MRRSLKLSSAIAATLSFSTPVFAVEPEPIEIGALNLFPTVDAEWTHSDNMYLRNTGAASSNLFEITPRLAAVAQSEGGSNLALEAQVMDGNYSISSVDDYTDWRAAGDLNLVINTRNLLSFNAYMLSSHEKRGTGYSQGLLDLGIATEYEDTYFGGNYVFGSEDSARLVLGLNTLEKSYTNLRAITRFRDTDRVNWNAAFYWSLSPRTDILVEYQATDVDYVTDPVAVVGAGDTLDSDESYFYVGVAWEATALTSGSIKIGQGEKEYTDADRVDVDGFSYELNIDWNPLTYSNVNFNATQGFGESYGIGNALDNSTLGITWVHEWSDRISSLASYSTVSEHYEGVNRSDDTDSISLGLVYNVQRWMDLNFSVSDTSKDSTFSGFSYDETSVALGLSLSL